MILGIIHQNEGHTFVKVTEKEFTKGISIAKFSSVTLLQKHGLYFCMDIVKNTNITLNFYV